MPFNVSSSRHHLPSCYPAKSTPRIRRSSHKAPAGGFLPDSDHTEAKLGNNSLLPKRHLARHTGFLSFACCYARQPRICRISVCPYCSAYISPHDSHPADETLRPFQPAYIIRRTRVEHDACMHAVQSLPRPNAAHAAPSILYRRTNHIVWTCHYCYGMYAMFDTVRHSMSARPTGEL